MQWSKHLANIRRNGPVKDIEIDEFERNNKLILPVDYVSFLKWSNGGVGNIGDNAFVQLWKLGDLVERNEACCVAEFAPGLLLFGSDGGGEAFAFDARTSAMPIVCVPFILELDAVISIAPTFTDFIALLYREGFPHAGFKVSSNS